MTVLDARGGRRRGWPERIASFLHRDVPLVVCDLMIVPFAYLMPLVLRLEAAVPPRYWANFRLFAPMAALLHLLVNHAFGLYGQVWRYASVQEARRVIGAGATGGVLVVVIGTAVGGRLNFLPLSVLVFGALLALFGFGAVRFQSRLFALRRRSALQDRSRVLVVGAGQAGSMVLKDVLRDASLGLQAVGIVDDDPRKVGRSLHGVHVLGTRADIPSLVERLRVNQVLLAIPTATSELVREMAALCEEAGVPLRVLPSVRDVVGGRVTARDIRDLRIEDLLGRKQVDMDSDAVAAMLSGRRVLITGAGGSIGTELARQVAGFAPSSLVLLDHDETHLHDALLLLRATRQPCEHVELVLADVRDQDRVLAAFLKYRPEVVFHTAAHKHVPFLEDYPEEAVRTNIIGTANVADAAMASDVGAFVLISTDKAVRPASVMGASKWFAEQIVRSYRQGDSTRFCAVRFGNVLGSRGSVIPTFFRQIAGGGPITVTDPAMARYFMSVQEAVQLVLQAATLSTGGEVFTLDMGEPVLIVDLARKLVRLSGLVPDRDIAIEFTGPRPGEKLVEDLVPPEERAVPSEHPSISVSRPPVPDQTTLRRAIWELETLAREGRTIDLAKRITTYARTGMAEAPSLGAVR